MRFFSKSGYEARGRCPRRWYYGYHYKGGWETTKRSRDLMIGILVHLGLEVLLRTEKIEDSMSAMQEEIERLEGIHVDEGDPVGGEQFYEDCALASGLVLGWYHTRYAEFLDEYEIISIEESINTLLAPDLTLVAKCDIVVRSKASGLVYVWNWKTTNEVKDWQTKWRYDIQMWTEAFAVEDKLGIEVTGCIVEGLYKGVLREGKWTSPLVRGWKRPMPDGSCVYSASRKTGKEWFTFPTYLEDRFGSLDEWVRFIPPEELSEMFIRSEPITKNNEVVLEWIRGVVKAETDAAHVLETGSEQDKLDHFEMRVSYYNCQWCPFRSVCFGASSIDSMIEAGTLRTAYHPSTEWNKEKS